MTSDRGRAGPAALYWRAENAAAGMRGCDVSCICAAEEITLVMSSERTLECLLVSHLSYYV